MIIRKIIILTVLGGQAIFIAGLLLLIFLSCITQLEARERGGGKLVRKKRERKERQRGSRQWEWVGSVCACGGGYPAHVCS